ncbi:ArsR/SmtB family transcription factor [Oceaniglobus roseus]|uniref:ArsR/SmtB family transcription factor n=1 Tax=Oceaniglobus roseus TaxID=1737570 RepID=UPI000C7EF96A|nr:metalloregulator ArsR/SmtB family transcription factor [Kandeliimicrobium roseum]
MDAIFKALNDPTRRALLDALRERDGQTLTDLEARLEMSRFGVMKHLNLLEDAGLITTTKKGRFKYHYLNALPLQEVIDRWIEPLLAKPAARAVLTLKAQLEGNLPMPLDAEKPSYVMSTYIDCTHDALWDALTKGDLISKYHFVCETVQGDFAEGQDVNYLLPNGAPMLVMRTLRIDPKSLIEAEFHPRWGGDETPSRFVYLVEPTKSGMKLTVEHYGLTPAQGGIADGWTRLLAGLKTFLETGAAHRFAMEAQA